MTNRNPDVHCRYCGRYMHSERATEVWLYHPELKTPPTPDPWCGECKKPNAQVQQKRK